MVSHSTMPIIYIRKFFQYDRSWFLKLFHRRYVILLTSTFNNYSITCYGSRYTCIHSVNNFHCQLPSKALSVQTPKTWCLPLESLVYLCSVWEAHFILHFIAKSTLLNQLLSNLCAWKVHNFLILQDAKEMKFVCF